MRISILGASGEVGRSVATHLLRGGLMTAADKLQLVGHGPVGTERKVLAERVDFLDAFDETAPHIDVGETPDDVVGDIIVMAAGATVSESVRTRRDLAAANLPVFEAFGAALARNGTGRELAVVVTNPVELGVEIFGRYLDRRRVLGMGAQQDSLRFARAIANSVGVRRDHVHAWVLGEHGAAQVPLWSSVRLLGMDLASARARIERLRGTRPTTGSAGEADRYDRRVFDLLAAGNIREAFDVVEALPPDRRIMIEPFVTQHCLHSTPNATANATCDVVAALRSGRESVVAAQVKLAGEFRGLRTVVGVPVLVDAAGWSEVICPPLADDEALQLDSSAEVIEANLSRWLS